MTRLDEIIEKVTVRSQKILDSSDELSKNIQETEDKIALARVTVWLDAEILEEREGVWQLGFAKCGSKWGFAVRCGEDDWRHTPLVRAPRKVRVAAAPHLAQVIELVYARLCEISNSIEEANECVERLKGESDGIGRTPERNRRRVRTSRK